MAEEFNLMAYALAAGWDPGAVCTLTEVGAQQLIASCMVEALGKAERGDVESAKRSVDHALEILTDEQLAGRTKQAERAAAQAAEEETG